MERDAVDRMLEKWAREWPALDVSPLAVVSRVTRAARLLDQRIETNFRRYGVSGTDYRLLATLRHTPEPRLLTPSALASAVMLTPGAVSRQLDRLNDRGLIERHPDPQDRRLVLVGLSPEGCELIEKVIVGHIANEHRLVQALDADEQAQIAHLLRRLLLSFGDVADVD